MPRTYVCWAYRSKKKEKNSSGNILHLEKTCYLVNIALHFSKILGKIQSNDDVYRPLHKYCPIVKKISQAFFSKYFSFKENLFAV